MPSMDKAIAKLKRRFTKPSADLIEQNPRCGICWNDFVGEDRPVKLPCGHVLGEECIISWAGGTTSTGRHHGCPYCRAELLPPSLPSRTSALVRDLSDSWSLMKILLGGGQGVTFIITIFIVGITADCWSEREVAAPVRLGVCTIMILLITMNAARSLGWREAVRIVALWAVATPLLGVLEVLFCQLFLRKAILIM